MIHPMFVCYESAAISNSQQSESVRDELKEEVEDRVTSYDVHQYIEEKIEEEYDNIQNHWVIGMLMPVDNTKQFQEMIQKKIYPYS
jgi:hypothetical protein